MFVVDSLIRQIQLEIGDSSSLVFEKFYINAQKINNGHEWTDRRKKRVKYQFTNANSSYWFYFCNGMGLWPIKRKDSIFGTSSKYEWTSNKRNENVTTSICIWASIILLPLTMIFEQPWNSTPNTLSIISVVYLGLVSTGLAWLLRFSILKKNGLIFQSQVSFLIPIFGIILGYIFLKELITPKIIVSVVLVLVGIYLAKKSND